MNVVILALLKPLNLYYQPPISHGCRAIYIYYVWEYDSVGETGNRRRKGNRRRYGKILGDPRNGKMGEDEREVTKHRRS